MDGHQMTNQNATKEAKQLETFLNIEHEIEFKFNPRKGFECLEKPIQYCLSDAKGDIRHLEF